MTDPYTRIDRCKLDDCRKQPMYYLAYGCMNQHVADTKVCRDHLKLVRELVVKQRWHCGDCRHPVVSGMYRLINPKTRSIITRKLDGTVVKSVPNPDYPDTDVDVEADLEGKCPCPRGHLGFHKFSCPKAKSVMPDNLVALPKKRSKVDEITPEDWAAHVV